MSSVLERLLPRQADNRFAGRRAALWLLGLYIALKLVMSFNSIFNTEAVAVGADHIPIGSYGAAAAREVLTLFALTALGQLALALVGVTVLVRYRSLVPFIYSVLLAEHLARRLIVQSYSVVRTDGGSTALYVNLALMGLLALGLLLSLLPRRQPSSAAVEG